MNPRLIPESLHDQIRKLPTGPGVYLFKDRQRKLVYIGKALSIRKRVLSHFRLFGELFSKEGRMLEEVRTVDFIETPTEAEALLLEASLVKENQPKFNQELKDDKSYPFLKITAEEFPRLLIVRGRKADGSKYYGPYTSVRLLKQAVKLLRVLFPMRTCRPMPKKVCLMYHIGQCKGPCVGEISKDQYHAVVKELGYFLEGRRDILLRNLFRKMREHSVKREYEEAKKIYEQVRALSAVPEGSFAKPKPARILKNLKEVLSLPKPPTRIEGFDISNIAGKEAVGSMVVFVEAKPSRANYRRFRIRTVQGIDDYEMMREVIRRRYTRVLNEKERLPDLVVIDGGKGHLAAASGELHRLGLRDLPILSIAKQHEHLFVPGREGPIVLPQNSPVLQLVQRLRDEAHRFAISYHRRLHKKQAMASALDSIPGVGPKTRERLLKTFGSVGKIKESTGEQLIGKARISRKTAGHILQALRQTKVRS